MFSNPVTATTSYSLPSFQILSKDYVVNSSAYGQDYYWPGCGYSSSCYARGSSAQNPYVAQAPQDVGFNLVATQTNGYCAYGNCIFSVGGYFTYNVDCGNGTPVQSVSGYAGGTSGWGSNESYNVFTTSPICEYTKPGVYQVTMNTNSLSGSSGASGGTTVTLLPSGNITDKVGAVPNSGGNPLNNVAINTNVSNMMRRVARLVTLTIRCNGNLALEQAIASGRTIIGIRLW